MILWNQPHELQTFQYSGGRKIKCPKILPHDMHVFQYPWGPKSKCPKILPHAKHVFQYPWDPNSKCPKILPHDKHVFQYPWGPNSKCPKFKPHENGKATISRGFPDLVSVLTLDPPVPYTPDTSWSCRQTVRRRRQKHPRRS